MPSCSRPRSRPSRSSASRLRPSSNSSRHRWLSRRRATRARCSAQVQLLSSSPVSIAACACAWCRFHADAAAHVPGRVPRGAQGDAQPVGGPRDPLRPQVRQHPRRPPRCVRFKDWAHDCAHFTSVLHAESRNLTYSPSVGERRTRTASMSSRVPFDRQFTLSKPGPLPVSVVLGGQCASAECSACADVCGCLYPQTSARRSSGVAQSARWRAARRTCRAPRCCRWPSR